jgi:hypothetical protein
MPFTAEQFFEVFTSYNQFVFPMQFVLVWAAFAAVLLAVSRKPVADEIISGILAFLWLWAGIVYHLVFFTRINSGAYIFSAMFIAQGIFFFHQGVVKKQLSFRIKPDFYGLAGAAFIAYALVIYPVIGLALGHIFPASPTFGVPCPTAVFTFGLLMWTDRKMPLYLLILPLLWAIVGSTATWYFGVAEDFGLPVTAVIVAFFIFQRGLEPKREAFL